MGLLLVGGCGENAHDDVETEGGTVGEEGTTGDSVASDDGSTGTSSVEDGSTTSAGGGGDESSTGMPPDLCGNGERDDGEACDDRNEIDGDGCNADCSASATVEWIQQWNSAPTLMDVVGMVSVGPSGRTALVGHAGYQGPDRFTLVYEGDGSMAWVQVETGGPEAVVVDHDDALIVSGASSDGRVLVRKLDPTGAVTWEYVDMTTSAASGYGIALDRTGEILVTGYSAGAGFLWRYDAAGKPTATLAVAGTRRVNDLVLVDDDAFVVGQLVENTDPWVARLSKNDAAVVWDHERTTPPATDDQAVAIGVDAAGYTTALVWLPDEFLPLVNRYEPDGTPVYQELVPFPGVALTDLVVDDSGDLFLVGYEYDNVLQVANGWVARLTPELEVIWEHVFDMQPTSSEARTIAFAPHHRIVIAGNVQGAGADVNVWTAMMTE